MGHVPLILSRVFHLFLTHGGQISVDRTGTRRKKGIGLEIPATYIFVLSEEAFEGEQINTTYHDKRQRR